jgi:Cu-processing system permease protein
MKTFVIDLANIGTLAGKEVRDSGRNRWFLLISLIFAGLSLGLSFFSFAGVGSYGISGFGRTAASLLNLILLVVPLMGLLLGATSLANEQECGTLNTLLAQPISSSELFIGKFFGLAAALMATLFLGFGLSGFIIGIRGGTEYVGTYLTLFGYTILLGFIFLGIGFLVSVFNDRSASAIGVALFLWFLFMFASDLGVMGTAIILKLSGPQLFWIAAFNPIQSFKMAVIGLIQGDLDILGSAGMYAVDLFGDHYIWALSAILLVWLIVILGVSLWCFRKKCAA